MRRRISPAAAAAAPSPSRNGQASPDASVERDASDEIQVEDPNAELRTWLDVRFHQLENLLKVLVEHRPVKNWYSTQEAAEILGKVEYTVREWCRAGRIHAAKKGSGRGKYQSWVISHQELLRIQKEGLLPIRRG